VVGARGGGCWRIRSKPDIPSPRSCSAELGDLRPGLWPIPASKETRSLPSLRFFVPIESRSPVLLFFGNLRLFNSCSGLSSFETICRRLESAGERVVSNREGAEESRSYMVYYRCRCCFPRLGSVGDQLVTYFHRSMRPRPSFVDLLIPSCFGDPERYHSAAPTAATRELWAFGTAYRSRACM